MNSVERALVYRLIDETKTGLLSWVRTQELPIERFEAYEPPSKLTLTGERRSEDAFLPYILSILDQETDRLTTRITEPPNEAGLLLTLFREVTGSLQHQRWPATPVAPEEIEVSEEVQNTLTNLVSEGVEKSAVPDLDPEQLSRIDQLTMQQIDELPYGVLLLDKDGRVLFYNVNGSQRSGLARENVEGKNFFSEIAPYTKSTDFFKRFQELASGTGGRMVETFNFTFRFPSGEHHAIIVMSHVRRTGCIRVLVLGRQSASHIR